MNDQQALVAVGMLTVMDARPWTDAKVESWLQLLRPLSDPNAARDASQALIDTTPSRDWDYARWRSAYNAKIAREPDRPQLAYGRAITLDEYLATFPRAELRDFLAPYLA